MYSWGVIMKRVTSLLLMFLVLSGCAEEPDQIYVGDELDFFVNKWWKLGQNPIVEEDNCYMLFEYTGNFLSKSREDQPNVGHILSTWTRYDDYISINNIYGLYLELTFSRKEEDLFVTVDLNSFSKETNLYNCDF